MSNHSEYPSIIQVKARAWHDRQAHDLTVKGQVARTLAALVQAGQNGVTALEVSSWAYRLGAYVHDLRHDHGLDIKTQREEHPGGWHARYVLQTPVEILDGFFE